MSLKETPCLFEVDGKTLLGIVHTTDKPATKGLLIIVGGPQYRVGSHRQFVLLARDLAAQGIPVMRFDLRGMGDSEGNPTPLIDYNQEIAAATNSFQEHSPGLEKIILWGLCDGASAIALNAHKEPRCCGAIMLNPWVRSEQSWGKTRLKSYYLKRLFDPSLWQKVVKGKFSVGTSFLDFFSTAQSATRNKEATDHSQSTGAGIKIQTEEASGAPEPDHLAERMAGCLEKFQHPLLIILSGNDLIADEFRGLLKTQPNWRNLINCKRVSQHSLPAADHTFAASEWHHQVSLWTMQWIKLFDI